TCPGGDDHRLYSRVHRARVAAAHGVLPDAPREESQREIAPAHLPRGADWSPTSAGASSRVTADAQHCPVTSHTETTRVSAPCRLRAQPETTQPPTILVPLPLLPLTTDRATRHASKRMAMTTRSRGMRRLYAGAVSYVTQA